jgi:predicted acyltransferase
MMESRSGSTGTATSVDAGRQRLVALDQLRGLTVAAMLAVNFGLSLTAVPPVLKHQDGWFTLADWIMPTFLFLVGFSFRLSWLSTRRRSGLDSATLKFLKRGLILVAISLFLYAGDDGIRLESWAEADAASVGTLLAVTLKASLWEALAIIGCAQILMIPFIGGRWFVRLGVLFGLLTGHAVLSHLFNWNFVHGLPNQLDAFLGTEGRRAWDGGLFGLIGWSALILGGSLAHDAVMSRARPARAAPALIVGGAAVALVGWGLLGSLSRLYDVPASGNTPDAYPRLAPSPVRPDFSQARGRALADWLPDPPLVPAPSPEIRPFNYWMLYKRMVSTPFVVFSTGVAATLLGLALWVCDSAGLAAPTFTRFGQNALAAYCLHHYLAQFQKLFVPDDSPGWWCLLHLCLFLLILDRALAWMQHKGLRFSV